MEQGDITKAHCNTCVGERKHFIIFAHHKEFHDQFADHPSAVEHGFDDYDLLQCAGCDRIAFRHTHESSQEPDEDGNIVPTVSYYPPATFRRRPQWLSGWEGFSIYWSHDFISRLLHERAAFAQFTAKRPHSLALLHPETAQFRKTHRPIRPGR